MSWFLSSCLVTALSSSPVETIATGSLLAAIRLPFVLWTARGRSNYRQVLGADAFIHGPFRAQPASRAQKPLGTAIQNAFVPPLRAPAVLKDKGIFKLALNCALQQAVGRRKREGQHPLDGLTGILTQQPLEEKPGARRAGRRVALAPPLQAVRPTGL